MQAGERKCAGCGADISHKAKQARTCSRSCQNRVWNRKHAEVNRARAAAWYYAHPERAAATRKDYARNNPEIVRSVKRRWAKRNPHKRALDDIARKTKKQQATPAWANQNAIRQLYLSARLLSDLTGVEFQIDHIYPIRSKVVCGLHCEANLRIVTADHNNRKGNKCLDPLPILMLAFHKGVVS